ncbi:MAG: DUF465 domain-containing protein [Deltaproteobacteria bacterium]|nr:DUF465 domain-containing protein [Deltaproteobacteria bacterium]
MERHEVELIQSLASQHDELRYLWSRHKTMEKDLARLDSIRNPSPLERKEISELKRNKLKGKERMQAILDAHRGL